MKKWRSRKLNYFSPSFDIYYATSSLNFHKKLKKMDFKKKLEAKKEL